MNEVKRQLEKAGRDILSCSRNEIYLSMRFMDIALSMLSYEMNLSTKTIGIDGMKILYNPRHLIDLFREDAVLVNRVYMHMLLHGLFGHVYKRAQRNTEYWDLACDIAVASVLDELPQRAVRQTPPDFRIQVYEALKKTLKVLTAEGIYRVLWDSEISGSQFDMLMNAFHIDDHQFWTHESEEDKSQKSRHRRQWEQAGEKVETGMQTVRKEYGDEAGGLLYRLKILHRERKSLKDFLMRFAVMGEEIKTDEDTFDYIFYTYGLKLYKNMPLIEPLEYKEVKKIEEFAIVVDTSQSCPEKLVRAFLTEAFAILKDSESFFRRVNIHLIQCDTRVTSDVKIESAEAVDRFIEGYMAAEGGGGTDFCPAFEYIDGLIASGAFTNLKGMLYLTDGQGRFPAKAPAYDAAFVFLDMSGYDVKVPPWAIKLILDEDDLLAEKMEEQR